MDSRISALLAVSIAIAFFLRPGAAATAARATFSRPRSDMASLGFIKSSCKVTRYPALCVASLTSYKGSFPATKRQLVKVAVNMSLITTRADSAWVHKLSKTRNPSKRVRAALKDCIENFGDTSEQMKNSLAELKHLRRETFQFQISNVQTWLSAALTNGDSCLDGFEKVRGNVKLLVSRRVQKSCKLISNALALVNNLAVSRGY